MRPTGLAAAALLATGCGGRLNEAVETPADASSGSAQQMPVTDASPADVSALDSPTIDSSDAGAQITSFAFIVNGAKQTPLACPSAAWEYPEVTGPSSVEIQNTGVVPIAYVARPLWDFGGDYIPGVATGDGMELVGVIAPGQLVDTTSEYNGGGVALLGSIAPFSPPGVTITDEGTIPWPASVSGSGGATMMQVAEIQVSEGCVQPYEDWR